MVIMGIVPTRSAVTLDSPCHQITEERLPLKVSSEPWDPIRQREVGSREKQKP